MYPTARSEPEANQSSIIITAKGRFNAHPIYIYIYNIALMREGLFKRMEWLHILVN